MERSSPVLQAAPLSVQEALHVYVSTQAYTAENCLSHTSPISDSHNVQQIGTTVTLRLTGALITPDARACLN